MRNPSWTRDELILALDLYRRSGDRMPGQSSAEVAALSDALNRIGAALGGERRADYRNANGVYMKLMNFRRFDPKLVAAGKRGLERGNKDEELVWNEFAHDQARLRAVARAIVDASTEIAAAGPLVAASDELEEAPEGRLLTALHVRGERNRALVERRKARALEQHGALRCEAAIWTSANATATEEPGLSRFTTRARFMSCPKAAGPASTSSRSFARIATV